jgi:hypothetical protein
MRKFATALAFSAALTGCAAIPAERVQSRIAQIGEAIDAASALGEAAAASGLIRPDQLAKLRGAIASARVALALASDAAAAGESRRAEALARQAQEKLDAAPEQGDAASGEAGDRSPGR